MPAPPPPHLPFEILTLILEEYTELWRSDTARRRSVAMKAWEAFQDEDGKPSEEEREACRDLARSSYQILPVLLTNTTLKDLMLPILYRHIQLCGYAQTSSFHTEPAPASYKHILSIEGSDGVDDDHAEARSENTYVRGPSSARCELLRQRLEAYRVDRGSSIEEVYPIKAVVKLEMTGFLSIDLIGVLLAQRCYLSWCHPESLPSCAAGSPLRLGSLKRISNDLPPTSVIVTDHTGHGNEILSTLGDTFNLTYKIFIGLETTESHESTRRLFENYATTRWPEGHMQQGKGPPTGSTFAALLAHTRSDSRVKFELTLILDGEGFCGKVLKDFIIDERLQLECGCIYDVCGTCSCETLVAGFSVVKAFTECFAIHGDLTDEDLQARVQKWRDQLKAEEDEFEHMSIGSSQSS